MENKKDNSNKLNKGVAIQISILIGFAVFYLITLFTGSVNLYVHPRIIPYMIFAAAAMIIMAILLCGELYKPDTKKKSWSLIIFIIPLMMAFTIPAQSFDSNTSTASDIQLVGKNPAKTSNDNISKQDEKDIAEDPESYIERLSQKESVDNTLGLQNGILVIDNGNYFKNLNRIYQNVDDYVGVKIELTGFVYKGNGEFSSDKFVPARLLMVCCAADLQTIGLLCEWDDAPELKEDTWVKVTGTIEEIQYNGELMPAIMAESVEPTEKPDKEYVYPY